jgi:hypothetical protein
MTAADRPPDLVKSLYTLARSLPWHEPKGMMLARYLVDAAEEIKRLRDLKLPKQYVKKPRPLPIILGRLVEAEGFHKRLLKRGRTAEARILEARAEALREAYDLVLNGKDPRDTK